MYKFNVLSSFFSPEKPLFPIRNENSGAGREIWIGEGLVGNVFGGIGGGIVAGKIIPEPALITNGLF